MNKLSLFFKIINLQNKILFNPNISFCGDKLRSRCSLSARFMCDGRSKIKINTIEARENCYFSAIAGGIIETGNRNFFNRNCSIVARKKITIGSGCSFGQNVCILDHDHAFGRAKERGESFLCNEITIGNNCWIGANTVILRGTQIGDGCVIGAGCVVKGIIPPNSLVKANGQVEIQNIEV